jgi:hypothetical protein
MGRKPSKPGAIPRFRARRQKSGAVHFYYDHGGKPRRETPLGSDYGLAIKRWAELEHASDLPPPAILLFRHVAEAYRREVIPTKAPRTQRDNMVELANLLAFFDDPPAPFEAIEPQHVKKYIRWRKAAPVRAQREKALLSHIWNWSAEEGYTALPNPCALVKAKGGSKGRKVYIEDDQFKAVWEKADACLRDLMDFAYLTGQRPGDCITDSAKPKSATASCTVTQGKTGKRLRIEVHGRIAGIDRAHPQAQGRVQGPQHAPGGQRVSAAPSAYTRCRNRFKAAQHGGWRAMVCSSATCGQTPQPTRPRIVRRHSAGAEAARPRQRHDDRALHAQPQGRKGHADPLIAERRDFCGARWKAETRCCILEAEVGIEPAYADLQSGLDSSNGAVVSLVCAPHLVQ